MARLVALASLAVLGAGCGPSDLELAQAVLAAALPITAVAWLLQLAYSRLLASARPGLASGGLPSLVTGAAAGGFLVFSCILHGAELDAEWVTMAFFVVGASFLVVHAAFLFVLSRVWGGRLFRFAAAIAWLVFGAPAVILALTGSGEHLPLELFVSVWIYTGYGGLVTAPVLLLVFGLAFHECHTHARQLAELEPKFPEARIVKGG